MFGFGGKKAPELLPANHGLAIEGKVAFHNSERNWTETFDLIALTASVLKTRQHTARVHKSWLEHPASKFTLQPQMIDFQPLEKGGVKTTTTVQVNHPVLCPNGVFEYQHSTGDNLEDSMRKGLEQWAETDFVTLLEALEGSPKSCTSLRVFYPEKDGKPARNRRAVLGPVTWLSQHPLPEDSKATKTGTDDLTGCQPEHAFCPCCLLTGSFDAFKKFIEDDHFYGVRLYAMRGVEGSAQADCRVNGEDWEPGAEALRKYVATWPPRGFEFRKQYIVLQNVAADQRGFPG